MKSLKMKSLMLRALATALAGAVGVLTMPLWPVIFAAVVWNDLCDDLCDEEDGK